MCHDAAHCVGSSVTAELLVETAWKKRQISDENSTLASTVGVGNVCKTDDDGKNYLKLK